MKNKNRQKENSRCTRLKTSIFGGKIHLKIAMVAVIIGLVAICMAPATGAGWKTGADKVSIDLQTTNHDLTREVV